MTDKRGYLTPQEQPVDFSCVKVYYPNDTLYLSALLGSLGYLATWRAWQQDSEKTGKLAAQLWKNANDLTYETLTDGCGGSSNDCELCEMTEEELRNLISEELEKMTITINNCNCGCGCGNGCTGTGGNQLPPGDIPDNTNPPTLPGSTQDITGDEVTPTMCAIANYMLLNWRTAIISINNGSLSQDGYQNFIYELFQGVWDWITDSATVFLETLGIFNASTSDTGVLVSEIDSNYDALQCAMMQEGTQAEIAQSLFDIVDGMALGFSTKYYMKKMLSYMPLTSIRESNVVNNLTIDEAYYNRGCPACVSVIEPADLGDVPANYIIVPALASEIDLDTTYLAGTYAPASGTIQVTRAGSGQDLFVDADGDAILARTGGQYIVGFIANSRQWTANSGEGLLDFAQTNGPELYTTEWSEGEIGISSNQLEYVGQQAFADWVDASFDEKRQYSLAYELTPTCTFTVRLNADKTVIFDFLLVIRMPA